jgi:hypothetical protein
MGRSARQTAASAAFLSTLGLYDRPKPLSCWQPSDLANFQKKVKIDTMANKKASDFVGNLNISMQSSYE